MEGIKDLAVRLCGLAVVAALADVLTTGRNSTGIVKIIMGMAGVAMLLQEMEQIIHITD